MVNGRDPARGPGSISFWYVAPYLFGGAHGFQYGGHHLTRTRARGFIGGLLLHQRGVRQDDAKLVVQPMEKAAKFLRLIHGAPLEKIGC